MRGAAQRAGCAALNAVAGCLESIAAILRNNSNTAGGAAVALGDRTAAATHVPAIVEALREMELALRCRTLCARALMGMDLLTQVPLGAIPELGAMFDRLEDDLQPGHLQACLSSMALLSIPHERTHASAADAEARHEAPAMSARTFLATTLAQRLDRQTGVLNL